MTRQCSEENRAAGLGEWTNAMRVIRLLRRLAVGPLVAAFGLAVATRAQSAAKCSLAGAP